MANLLEVVEGLEPLLRSRVPVGGLFTAHMGHWSTPRGAGFDGVPLFRTPEGWQACRSVGGLMPWQPDPARSFSSVAEYLRTWWQPYNAANRVIKEFGG